MVNRTTAGVIAAAACGALMATGPAAYALGEPTPLAPDLLSEQTQMAPARMVNMTPAELVTNGPQANPGDSSTNWSPQRNVAESNQYERLLKANPGFRQARIRKECGPIDDPALRQQCVTSFQ
jgi:hypothetical protein